MPSVSEILNRHVVIHPHEAVAIAQQLIDNTASRLVSPPFGPPSVANVELDFTGSATCSACATTPAVSEIAILLRSILGAPGNRTSGGLEYLIARALLEVDAPPFDSIAEFARALERFERGSRRDVVRALVSRARDAESEAVVSASRQWAGMSVVAAGFVAGVALIGASQLLPDRHDSPSLPTVSAPAAPAATEATHAPPEPRVPAPHAHRRLVTKKSFRGNAPPARQSKTSHPLFRIRFDPL